LRDAQGLVDLGDVMPVDDDGSTAERLGAPPVGAHVPFQFGGAALAEPVHVDDRGEVAELVVGGLVQRLPHRPLGHLAVAAQHPHLIRQLVQAAPGQRDAHPVGQPLAQ